MQQQRPKLVSFSGIDGAGKSTQIEALLDHLNVQGFRAELLTFWDNVVAFRKLREFLSLKTFKGDKGVGSPEKPIMRRDKNVVGWHTTAVRLFFYLLDAMSLRRTVTRMRRSDSAYVIFDRYIYDELANLPLNSSVMRWYVRVLLRLSPKPDVAFVVDADPEAAYRRKPEYPLAFVKENRNAYLRLSDFAGGMNIVGPASIEIMKAQIVACITSASDVSSAECVAAPVALSSGSYQRH